MRPIKAIPRKWLVVGIIMLLLVGTVSSASAWRDPGVGVWFSGGTWTHPTCEEGAAMGTIEVRTEANVPTDYVVRTVWVYRSPSLPGGIRYYENKWIQTVDWVERRVANFSVPNDGTLEAHYWVYSPAPINKLVTHAAAYASCVTGNVKVTTITGH
jgi:hypothetical protein